MWVFLVFFMYVGGNKSPPGPPAGPSSTHSTEHKILTSQRGKPVLFRAGHKYNLNRKNKDSCVWRCSKRNVCKATLIINSDNSIKREDRHNCEPDFETNELEIKFNECIEKVKTDYTVPIPSVYRQTVSELRDKDISIIKKIPTYKNVKNKLYRNRNKSLGVKKICFNAIEQVVVPEKFTSFLLADYYCFGDRILVFAGEHCKTILANPNLTVLCDGTFKFCLNPFHQLYTLHVDLGSSTTHNNIIPVIYALLPNKNKITYRTLFYLIKSQIPQFDPKNIIMDFEHATMSAIEDVFPEACISGCFFHFSRSLWRKADEIGITKSSLARKHIKRCTVLAHLPSEVIDDGWLYIVSQCPNDEKIVQFNDYFVDTWLRETSFFAKKWSCSNKCHRTTNLVESWHSTVNKKVNDKPKSIAHFLTILLQEDNYYKTLYLKGSNITTKKKETCDIDEHIATTISEFRKGNISIELCIENLII